ncbi:MAG: T9SS type A sorting domain-containing protein [Saprospiraceae bacterium]|nr:T9SS type A sorting domain-containing protein [Saprospiraceae bacterium]
MSYTYGPFAIIDGDLILTITDANNANCTTIGVVTAPATCSDVCDLDEPVVITECDDNGTPSDPSDDTYTYTIEVTGANTGSTYNVAGDDTHAGLLYGVVNGPFGPFPISGGDLDITVVDADDAGCTYAVTVEAPATCSGVCNLDVPVISAVCNDNGTPSDPSDDTFEFTIEVTGANTAGTYSITGDYVAGNLAYGVAYTFGPFNIADGDLILTITDGDDANCQTIGVVTAPATCSDQCDLDEPVVLTFCDNNGTPSDPSDDTFTYYIEVSGANTAATYDITGDDSQAGLLYDVVNGPFGPFAISDGDLDITIVDADDAGCTYAVTVEAPATCSGVCNLDVPVISAVCDDNGTPSDPSDDTFEFTITVTGSNTAGSYNITGDYVANTLAYGTSYTFGPFNIADGDLILTITDANNANCTTIGVVTAPATCSDVCDLNEPIVTTTCDDNGTPTDPSDDTFTYTIEVNGANTGATYSIAGDDTQSGLQYGVQNGPFGPFDIADGDLNITVIDADDAGCTYALTVVAPASCSDLCDLNAPVIVATCFDNGTPSDPSDDYFEFTLQVTGVNTGSAYNVSGDLDVLGLSYGVINGPYGPYPIASGDLSINIIDADDPTCSLIDIAVNAPQTCSDVCDLNEPIVTTTCFDNGTPSNPSDDYFTYTIEVTGANTGATYDITGDDTQNDLLYGVANGPFGPFPISGGDLDITIVDADDAGCTYVLTVDAPASCSDVCDLDVPVISAVCDDNGTPSDPSDDTFEFTIEVTGANTAGTYSITGDYVAGNLAYGVAYTFGPFNIADGDLILTITDGDDANCQTIGVVTAPATCSDLCDLDEPVVTTTCFDNGTPADPSDDYFTYTIEVTGANTAATYDIVGDDIQNNLLYGVANGPFGPFPISGGSLDITVVDNSDASCTYALTIDAPASCSDQCDLNVPVISAVCDDNGTPSDPSDDTFEFTITVTGANTSGVYNITGDYVAANLAYGTAYTFGPFNIADGDLILTITDGDDANCQTIGVVTAPATCSDQCDLDEPVVLTFCDDNGTPADPSDDTYTYYIEVSGANTGTTYNVVGDDNQSGLLYNVVNGPFGPFNISGGNLDVTVVDADDPSCNYPITIMAPASCSDECDLNVPVISAVCDDNGTPSDPSDDTFEFTITVTGSNTSGVYNITGDYVANNLAYGTSYTFGPFNIADGDLILTITDGDDANCQTIGVVTAPATCSDQCDLDQPVVTVTCDDNGTPTDPSDDTFTYTIEVTGVNLGASYSIAGDDTHSGLLYGIQNGPFGPFDIANGNLDITIIDSGDASCTADVTVVAPEACSDVCNLDPPTIVATCFDNGTPSDPSDDYFEFTIQVTGANTAGTYNITGDFAISGQAYGVVNGPFGPFPIAGGDLSITITDSNDPTCQLIDIAVNAPETCSDVCDLDEPVVLTFCDDNGTPSDPSDDTFTYFVEVTGANTASTYNITGDDAQTGLLYGIVNGPFGPFNILDGNLDIIIVDNNDPNCNYAVTVNAPASCSNECDLNVPVISAVCDDNGTPSDPSDDTFEFTITVTGDNTAGTFNITGDYVAGNLAYGVAHTFGPFDIVDGDLTLTITDANDLNCETIGVVNAPATCSDLCELNEPVVTVECDDNGTPTDPSDDTFTYTIELTGANTGTTYNISGDDTQLGLQYGIQNGPFGPFDIANGNLDLVIFDSNDINCTLDVEIVAPESCSELCTLEAPIIVATCNDNGTPTDPSDDYFTFTIEVNGVNTAGTYNISGDLNINGLAYGVINGPYGNYPIVDGDLSINITDALNPLCNLIDIAVNAPASCSDQCELNMPVVTVDCDDNGTPTNPLDDTFTYTIEVTGDNTSGTYNITGDDTQTGLQYGIQNGPFGPFSIANGNLDITVVDSDDANCTYDLTIDAPVSCSDDCVLNAPTIVATCNNNGTPTDPSDDYFTFTILMTGANTGGSYGISGDFIANGLQYGVVNGPFGNFPIGAGDLSINITDSQNPLCNLIDIAVNAPQECSDECEFNNPVVNVFCDDNGTPTDPTDDTFTYTIEVSGANVGSSYSISGDDIQTGLPYAINNGPFGPFDISNGNLDLVLTDDQVGCTYDLVINAPEPCSGACEIDSNPTIIAKCNDNGTPFDPSDDVYYYSLVVTGTNTGATYNITGDDFHTGLAYGVQTPQYGPFAIVDGNLTLVIVDVDDPACNLTITVVAPDVCSGSCEIAVNQVAVFCNDNGTPNDPTDDTFSYTINVSGVSTGTAYNITGDDTHFNLPYNTVNGPFGQFDIADGPLQLTISDVNAPGCEAEVTIIPPAPCSNQCEIGEPVIMTVCNNNGTENDPSDDTFTFTLLLSGNAVGLTYNLTGDVIASGLSYGMVNGPFGPFPIAGGDLSITAVDGNNSGCILNIIVEAPETCSDVCNLFDPQVIVSCDDAGTPNNPNDDLFYYTITVNGNNTGSSYDISGEDIVNNLPYGVPNGPNGPFLISQGDLDLVITDSDNPGCFTTVTVDAPVDCSPDCSIFQPAIGVQCNDNGTPDDPSDDTFSYLIYVTGNNTGSTYTIAGDDFQTNQPYNQVNGPLGNFPISGGIIFLDIIDNSNPSCNIQNVAVVPPPSCSFECSLQEPLINVACDDNGTPDDFSDDTFTFTILVQGNSTGAFYNILGDVNQGGLPYNTVNGPFGPYPIAGGNLDIVVQDIDEPTCNINATVEPPVLCITDLACIGDFVWHDLNGNGAQDLNEPGIQGVEVILTGTDVFGNDVMETMFTDADGEYLFCGLNPGTYKLTFVTPTGYEGTIPNATGDDSNDSDADPNMGGMTDFEVLSSGETNLDYDAGYIQSCSIGNYVWHDINGDGFQDANEPGIPNVEVVLTGTDGAGNLVILITFTDGDGFYLFDNLNPGTYKLTFETPAGGFVNTWLDATGDDATDSDADPAMGGMTVFEVLTSGENNLDYDAGYYIPAAIGNFVWEDLDADGAQDAGEPGIPGVQVTLTGFDALGNTVVLFTMTDANGFYLFTGLAPGSYKLTFQTPAGYITTLLDATGDDTNDSDANASMGGMTVFEDLISGELNLDYDAGYVQGSSDLAAIGNYVWEDTDGDGFQDTDEPGIEGVTVVLSGTDVDGNDVNLTTQTDGFGFYIFTGLTPGTYKLTFQTPAGYILTTPNATGDDSTDSDADPAMGGMTVFEVLEPGEVNLTYDAGYIPATELGTIGNYVWEDLDNDGIQDAGEPGVPGVTVYLYDCNDLTTPIAQTTTNGAGFYFFTDLPAGNYAVQFVLTGTDLGFTMPNAGGNDSIDSDANPNDGFTDCIFLPPGEDNLTLDAGVVPCSNDGPTAVCIDDVTVTLDSDGMLVLPADFFDGGSYDDCCLDDVLVRRIGTNCGMMTDTLFGQDITFCCNDVTGGVITVELMAVDCQGNVDICELQVTVDGTLSAAPLSCPADTTISCDVYGMELAGWLFVGEYGILDQFGVPTTTDGGCPISTDLSVAINIDMCMSGTITRTWISYNDLGEPIDTCSQIITVVHESNFVVEFPADTIINCNDIGALDTGEPIIFDDMCELVGVSYEDFELPVVPDACRKIVRTWYAVNWCLFEEFGSDVYSEISEVVAGVDFNGDGVLSPNVFQDGVNPQGISDGWIQHVQIIKIIDTEVPEFDVENFEVCSDAGNCVATVNLPEPDVIDCSDEVDITIQTNLPNGSGYGPYTDVPLGEYWVLYTAYDNCGNISADLVTITVVDCIAMNIQCASGLSFALDADGTVTIPASALDGGSTATCGVELAFAYSEDMLTTDRTFGCEDLGLVELIVWVEGSDGQQGFCAMLIEITDPLDACSQQIMIAGLMVTEDDEPVGEVMTDINGGFASMITSEDGLYEFQLATNSDYTVSPFKDIYPGNGISTLDMVLIQKHVLGLQLLDSPYKIIAADVNNSGSVTTLDLLEVQKMVLQINDQFTNNTSWRFVDADYVFPDPTNPWFEAFPEVISYNNIQESDLEADFIAVKIGDVNGSANTNGLAEADNRNTPSGNMGFMLEDRVLKAGETATLIFTGDDSDILGYQFTLDFDPAQLQIKGVEEGVAQPESFGLAKLEQGGLTASLSSPIPFRFSSDEAQFKLIVEAQEDLLLSEALAITSRFTKAEGYDSEGKLLQIGLYFSEKDGFALYQNKPNPFVQTTNISFYLPVASEASLTIMDVSGRVLKVIESEYSKGLHEVEISNLQSSGLLYYRLDTPTHSATKKMIMIE